MITTEKCKAGTRRAGFQDRISQSSSRKMAQLDEKTPIECEEDEYDRKVELIRRAFNEISRLCLEYDYTLSPDDWRALDEARLDEPALSYAELREQLVKVYRRIKRSCLV